MSGQGFWAKVLTLALFFAIMTALYYIVHAVILALPWQLVGIVTLTVVSFLVGWDYGEKSAARNQTIAHPWGDGRDSESGDW